MARSNQARVRRPDSDNSVSLLPCVTVAPAWPPPRGDRVVVTGVVTDVCVSTTAREAADRNFTVVVVSDACTTFSEKLHQANLETLHVFGWIRETDDVIRMAQKAQARV